MQLSTCPACGHHVSVPFYNGGHQPLTTLAYPPTAEDARTLPTFPLDFVRCVDCGHVYNQAFKYEDVPYSEKNYLMYNAGKLWQDHLRTMADLLLQYLPAKPVVIEIGCGEGHLLRAMAEACPQGRFIGFDPNENIACVTGDADAAIIGRMEARRELFDPSIHLAEYRPDLIISRHVLEHLINPLGFLQSMAFSADWEGIETKLFIEVPCIDRVFETGRTVDFFYEHNSHFTTTSLERMLSRCTGEVLRVERGYNDEVVYGLATLRPSAERAGFAQAALQFHHNAQEAQRTIAQQLAQIVASGKSVAIWGGTGKGSAFINRYGIDAQRFPRVIDSDRRKKGDFVPGQGQTIDTPDTLLETPADILIISTQWRAKDILLEIQKTGITYQSVLIEHDGRLVDFHKESHPYQ
jgi:hypothetical protein